MIHAKTIEPITKDKKSDIPYLIFTEVSPSFIVARTTEIIKAENRSEKKWLLNIIFFSLLQYQKHLVLKES